MCEQSLLRGYMRRLQACQPSLPLRMKRRFSRRHAVLQEVCLLLGCLTSQQHASVSQGRICSDNFKCCHTEIEVSIKLSNSPSHSTDTGPTSPSTDLIMSGARQGSHWSHRHDSTRKNPVASGIRTPDLPLPRRTPKPPSQRGGQYCRIVPRSPNV